MNQKSADEVVAYIEESRVVFATLEDKIEAFNIASSRLENNQKKFDVINEKIENIGSEIAKKINLKNVEDQVEKSVSYLFDADLEVQKYAKSLKEFKTHHFKLLFVAILSASVGAIIGVLLEHSGVTQKLFNLFT